MRRLKTLSPAIPVQHPAAGAQAASFSHLLTREAEKLLSGPWGLDWQRGFSGSKPPVNSSAAAGLRSTPLAL